MPFLKLSPPKAQKEELVSTIPPVPNINSKQIYIGFDGDGTNTPSTGNTTNVPPKGTKYELYIGSLYEQKGYEVDYNGQNKHAHDLCRDLICKFTKKYAVNNKYIYTVIVQCKCYDSVVAIKNNITVLEIYKFYGSVRHYAMQYPKEIVHAVFCTTFDMRTECYEAFRAAIELGIEVHQEIFIP